MRNSIQHASIAGIAALASLIPLPVEVATGDVPLFKVADPNTTLPNGHPITGVWSSVITGDRVTFGVYHDPSNWHALCDWRINEGLAMLVSVGDTMPDPAFTVEEIETLTPATLGDESCFRAFGHDSSGAYMHALCRLSPDGLVSWFDDFDNASYPNLSDLGPLTQQGIALRASLEGRTAVLWLDELGWAELVSTVDIAPGSTRRFGSLRPLAVSDFEVIFAGTLDLGNGNQSGFGLYAVSRLGGPSRLIVEPGDVNYASAERGVIRYTNAYGVNNWTWIYETSNATTWPLVADAIVPGTNVRFRSVGQISTNGPDMLFHGAATTDIHGVFLYRSGTITRIVGYGDTVDGGFVDGHSSTNQALSEAGAAIQLSFAFGSRAVYFADLRGFVPCPDLTNDGTVALGDLSILLANFGKTGIFGVYGDLDGDEDVDIADLALMLSSFGTDCW